MRRIAVLLFASVLGTGGALGCGQEGPAEKAGRQIDEAAGNKAVSREVEIGGRRPGEVEIVAGLREGEKVVTHGTLTVRPGQQVTITTVETADQPAREMGKPGEGS